MPGAAAAGAAPNKGGADGTMPAPTAAGVPKSTVGAGASAAPEKAGAAPNCGGADAAVAPNGCAGVAGEPARNAGTGKAARAGGAELACCRLATASNGGVAGGAGFSDSRAGSASASLTTEAAVLVVSAASSPSALPEAEDVDASTGCVSLAPPSAGFSARCVPASGGEAEAVAAPIAASGGCQAGQTRAPPFSADADAAAALSAMCVRASSDLRASSAASASAVAFAGCSSSPMLTPVSPLRFKAASCSRATAAASSARAR